MTASDTIYMATLNSVNIDSGNGLLPDGNKPLPDPIIVSEALWSSEGNVTENAQDIGYQNTLQNGTHILKLSPYISGNNELK